ncbi:hypothetical protein [Bosea sp. ANAM02]|uniref:hypothetical protein n=1 Tax=Bosea sp. ANAM02 TaxID=2020412 RepID=UPI001567C17A|nr:hypothetical protein [Bosea sp. ANAM02]
MTTRLSRFGAISLPLLGGATAGRWTTNHGVGADVDGLGATAWLGRWELVADRAIALPILAPLAMLASFLPRSLRAG